VFDGVELEAGDILGLATGCAILTIFSSRYYMIDR
jgi:hypothetical protein